MLGISLGHMKFCITATSWDMGIYCYHRSSCWGDMNTTNCKSSECMILEKHTLQNQWMYEIWKSHTAKAVNVWDMKITHCKSSMIYTIFIQIDAHALIDAHPHPLHHQPVGTHKYVKLMISASQMHGVIGQVLRPSLCTNYMYCSRSVHYYWNEYGICYYTVTWDVKITQKKPSDFQWIQVCSHFGWANFIPFLYFFHANLGHFLEFCYLQRWQ